MTVLVECSFIELFGFTYIIVVMMCLWVWMYFFTVQLYFSLFHRVSHLVTMRTFDWLILLLLTGFVSFCIYNFSRLLDSSYRLLWDVCSCDRMPRWLVELATFFYWTDMFIFTSVFLRDSWNNLIFFVTLYFSVLINYVQM